MFRELTQEEAIAFIHWADDNWRANTKPNPLYHPVIRERWAQLDDMYKETQLRIRHNNDHDQQEYSRARFNANVYRRLAFSGMLEEAQRLLHVNPTLGAFTVEKCYGCPPFWSHHFAEFRLDD